MSAVRKHEERHHTPEEVNYYIEQALVLLAAHELTPEERASVLPTIVTLISGKHVTFEQVVPAGMVLPQRPRH